MMREFGRARARLIAQLWNPCLTIMEVEHGLHPHSPVSKGKGFEWGRRWSIQEAAMRILGGTSILYWKAKGNRVLSRKRQRPGRKLGFK